MLLPFFYSPGVGHFWTHSPAEQYFVARVGGFVLSLPPLYWSRQLQESLGYSPSQSFSVICFTHPSCFKRDSMWQSRGMRGRRGKEKVALRWRDFSVLPYQLFVTGISCTSDPLSCPCLSATSSVEEEYFAKDLSLTMYRLQTGERPKYFSLAVLKYTRLVFSHHKEQAGQQEIAKLCYFL